jgi:hypothetical protein
MVEDKIGADEAIRTKVAELTQDVTDVEEKVKAIYHWVAGQVRYVGLEYGEGGFRPHRASEIFANKYGDCKDKAILLITMLREIGVQAHPVLIGTLERIWELQEDIPMAQFNHCIAQAEVNGRLVWLDPTDETCPYGEFPGYNQGRLTLVCDEHGPRFMTTPVHRAEENLTAEKMELEVGASGSIVATRTRTYIGDPGQDERRHLKWYSPEERVDMIKDEVNAMCPGAVVETHTISDLDDLNVPVRVEYRFSASEYAKHAGDLLVFSIPGIGQSPGVVGKEAREHAINWYATDREAIDVVVRIPEGYRIRYMPEPVELASGGVAYRHRYVQEDGAIHFTSREERTTREVTTDNYPEYKVFRESVARELDKLIVLEKVDPGQQVAAR